MTQITTKPITGAQIVDAVRSAGIQPNMEGADWEWLQTEESGDVMRKAITQKLKEFSIKKEANMINFP
jgi:hypothetical protein